MKPWQTPLRGAGQLPVQLFPQPPVLVCDVVVDPLLQLQSLPLSAQQLLQLPQRRPVSHHVLMPVEGTHPLGTGTPEDCRASQKQLLSAELRGMRMGREWAWAAEKWENGSWDSLGPALGDLLQLRS